MNYLFDVHELVAWSWLDHADHKNTVHWIAKNKTVRGAKLVTSSIPEMGLVRVSVQRSVVRISVFQAAEVLQSMLESLGAARQFLRRSRRHGMIRVVLLGHPHDGRPPAPVSATPRVVIAHSGCGYPRSRAAGVIRTARNP